MFAGGGDDGGFLVQGAGAEADGGTFGHQLAQVRLGFAVALHADGDQAAVGVEGVEVAVEVLGADDVEDDVGAVPCGGRRSSSTKSCSR